MNLVLYTRTAAPCRRFLTSSPPYITRTASIANARKMAPAVQLTENKVVTATPETGTMSRPLADARIHRNVSGCPKADVVHVILRLLCVATSVTALAFMATAKEAGSVSVYGFNFPVHSKWSFSTSFKYIVGMSAAASAHSLLQLLVSLSRLMRKSPVIPSRTHAWLIFAGDQVFAYAMLSAGSAASGVTNLNRTGIQHTALPNFCKPLHSFCSHVVVSVAFTFLSCFLLAASAVQDVIWLSNN